MKPPKKSELEKRWTKVLVGTGYTVLPNIVLEKQDALNLEPLDLNILLQIARHWWSADKLPYPGRKTIAQSIGVSPRTVQRRIALLKKNKLIESIPRRRSGGGSLTNSYSFKGLIEKATPYAKEALQQRARHRHENEERRRRRRARLPGQPSVR